MTDRLPDPVYPVALVCAFLVVLLIAAIIRKIKK